MAAPALTRGQAKSLARGEALKFTQMHRVSFVGDSITAIPPGDGGRQGTTWAGLFPFLGGGRIWFVGNYAVTGSLTSDVLASQLASALADSSQFIACMIGTNDCKGGIALATIKANIQTIVADILAAGKTPILSTIPPLSWTNVALWKANAETLNDWLRGYAAAHGYPIIDAYEAVVERSTGNLTPAYTADGLHPNDVGRRLIANRAVSDVLGRFSTVLRQLPLSNADLFNLLPNALFLTDANVDGKADQWTLAGSASNITLSLEAASSGIGNAQVMTWAANQLNYMNYIVSSGFSVGDTIRFAGRVSAVNAAAGGLRLVPSLVLTSTAITLFPLWTSQIAPDVAGGFWSADIVLPAGTTGLDVRLSGNGGTGSLKWEQVMLRNMTTYPDGAF